MCRLTDRLTLFGLASLLLFEKNAPGHSTLFHLAADSRSFGEDHVRSRLELESKQETVEYSRAEAEGSY